MTFESRKTSLRLQAAAAAFGAALFAASSPAQTPSDQVRFTGAIYGYFPQIGGSATFPTGTSANITVDPSNYLGNLKFAFMGILQAEKGPWDFFADLLYIDLSGSKSQTRDFSLGSVAIPASVTADANLKVKTAMLTLAGGYDFVQTPEVRFGLFAGARDLVLKQTLSYTLSADVPPLSGTLRQGSTNVNIYNLDGIVGAKGQLRFGERREWFVPYYVDVGTGESQLTWQTYAGLGYAFGWGEIVGVWRYVDYRFAKQGGPELTLNGPSIGVAFHWQ